MDRLERDYGDQIDFVHLNYDRPEVPPFLEQYNVRRRSSYVLVDPEGNMIDQWVGPIQWEALNTAIEDAIAEY